MGEVHFEGKNKEDIQSKIVKADGDSMQFLKHAAKKCRKLKSGRICFSPESFIWIKREQIYKSLVEYHLGRNKNRGNMKRAARKQGIKDPFQISMAELNMRLEVCKERNNYFRKHGAWY